MKPPRERIREGFSFNDTTIEASDREQYPASAAYRAATFPSAKP
jgi:hypothetical protein